jgi:Mrp family chromosome partitioning ATPase
MMAAGPQAPETRDPAADLAKAVVESAERRALYEDASRFPVDAATADFDTIPIVFHSPLLTQLRLRLTELDRRDADLSAVYGPAYPALSQIHTQRLRLQRDIKAELVRLRAVLKTDADLAATREAALRGTLADLSPAPERPTVTDDPQAALVQPTPVPAPSQPKAQTAPERPPAAALVEADRPSESTSDFPIDLALLGIAVALALALAATLLAVFARKKKVRVALAVRPIEVPVVARNNAFILGRIPEVGPIGQTTDLAAYMDREPGSDFAWSIEAVASKLTRCASSEGRVVTLFPLSAGEGATSVAICLAEAVAKAGKNVLLIDADSTSRGLSCRMNAAGQPGLAEVVAGEISASKAVLRRPAFALLPVGRAALAVSDTLESFLAETRVRFDLVLIDAAAFTPNAEAFTLAALSDAFTFVASSNRLMRDTFIAAIDAVADKPGFAGIVLNRVPDTGRDGVAIAV